MLFREKPSVGVYTRSLFEAIVNPSDVDAIWLQVQPAADHRHRLYELRASPENPAKNRGK